MNADDTDEISCLIRANPCSSVAEYPFSGCRLPNSKEPMMRLLLLATSLVAISLNAAFAQMPDLKKTPLPTSLLAPEAKVAVAAGICFLEGPAVDAAGNVFFSDIEGNRILKMDTAGN